MPRPYYCGSCILRSQLTAWRAPMPATWIQFEFRFQSTTWSKLAPHPRRSRPFPETMRQTRRDLDKDRKARESRSDNPAPSGRNRSIRSCGFILALSLIRVRLVGTAPDVGMSPPTILAAVVSAVFIFPRGLENDRGHATIRWVAQRSGFLSLRRPVHVLRYGESPFSSCQGAAKMNTVRELLEAKGTAKPLCMSYGCAEAS